MPPRPSHSGGNTGVWAPPPPGEGFLQRALARPGEWRKQCPATRCGHVCRAGKQRGWPPRRRHPPAADRQRPRRRASCVFGRGRGWKRARRFQRSPPGGGGGGCPRDGLYSHPRARPAVPVRDARRGPGAPGEGVDERVNGGCGAASPDLPAGAERRYKRCCGDPMRPARGIRIGCAAVVHPSGGVARNPIRWSPRGGPTRSAEG